MDPAARIRLAAALRSNPGNLPRVAQARLWQRGQILLLGGRLTQPWDLSVTPQQLKEWFQALAIGVNLGNTQTKQALARKAADCLAKEVEGLPASEAAARRHINLSVAGSTSAQGVAPHSMPHLGGLPSGLAQVAPFSSAPGMPDATYWQRVALAMGLAFAPNPNAVVGYQSLPMLFQGAQPPSL